MDVSEFKIKQLLEQAGGSDALTEREKHLVGLAVTITRGCDFCTGGRIEKALESGIEYETVRATIDLVGAVNAGVALRTALLGADKVEACNDGTCEA